MAATMAALLRPVMGPETAVLSLQNGVDNVEKLARLLGAGEVLGGAAYIFANIAAPGVIAHHQLGRIVFGAMRGGRSERIDAVAQAFARAGIPFEIASDIRKTLWEKYLALTPLAGVTALTRLPVKFLREVAETRRLWEMQLDELLALARAEGVGLDPAAKARATSFIEALAPANYSSLYQDLVQGKRLELEALHGHALALGARHGVPTPALFAVYAALKPYAMGVPTAG
jgi:2-dehydropantoate 2-reductase